MQEILFKIYDIDFLFISESDLDSVHVVDFGNAIHYVHKEVSLYYKDFELQTPLYRAPEVLLYDLEFLLI